MNDSRRILKRPQAELDITELFGFLLARNQTAARRFLSEIRKTFELIRDVPGIGQKWNSPHAIIGGLRVTTVSKRFHDYLIFYMAFDDRVEIVRVVHGARDLTALIDSLPGGSGNDQE